MLHGAPQAAPELRLLFAYEEALGIAVNDVVRDKDGISAAMLVTRLATEARVGGKTREDRLDDLARRFGLHLTRQVSLELPGPQGRERIDAAMLALRECPPTTLLGRKVEVVDDLERGLRRCTGDRQELPLELPRADVLVLRCRDGTRVVARPRVSSTSYARRSLAAIVDQTLLAPEATEQDVRELCAGARELRVWSLRVNATMVSVAADELDGGKVRISSVIGFPSGAHRTAVKAREAGLAVEEGAHELDMVINLAAARDSDFNRVSAEIAKVRAAAPGAILKVILEAGALSRDQIVAVCEATEQAGAQYVKTSTGFHPSGGATTAQVRLLAETVGDRLGVKAAGGIRDAPAALSMVSAGATRLGLSHTRSVLDGMPDEPGSL